MPAICYFEKGLGSPAANLPCIQRWTTSDSRFSYFFLLSADIVSVNHHAILSTNTGSCFNHLSIVCIVSWRSVVYVTWDTPLLLSRTFDFIHPWVFGMHLCVYVHTPLSIRERKTQSQVSLASKILKILIIIFFDLEVNIYK